MMIRDCATTAFYDDEEARNIKNKSVSEAKEMYTQVKPMIHNDQRVEKRFFFMAKNISVVSGEKNTVERWGGRATFLTVTTD